MKRGDLIAVHGDLYEYEGTVESYGSEGIMHKVYDVEVDEDGMLTATGRTWYLTEEELLNREIHFTKQQWYGIVAHFIREGNFHLNEEEMEDATEDIVGRCFAYGIPKFEELPEYIADYMQR